MILLTVGGQMPFDRLVRAVDQWAANHPETTCFAQVGCGGWRPQHMEWDELLSPPVFRDKLQRASLVIGHAGMGTILTALDLGKRLIVVPRRAHLSETRNDHQLATAKRLEGMGLVEYAIDEVQLLQRLSQPDTIQPRHISSSAASPELLQAVRSFLLAAGSHR
jgi:UDP-N-acetylglucosamine transferase subunit ALG13